MKESIKHTKHTSLIKPLGGEYHRNEWTLIGAPCGIIDSMATEINEALKNSFKIGYLDAAHQSSELPQQFHSGFTDNISHKAFYTTDSIEQKQHRKFYNHLDILLVNGNHFKGDKQIVFINDKKKESLHRKLDRLTDIRMVIVESNDAEIFDFIKPLIKDKEDIAIHTLTEIKEISAIIKNEIEKNIPPLYALILAGGKSQRMGEDKGGIHYHQKAQREHEADLANPLCQKTFISCRKNQEGSFKSAYEKLFDTFEGLGPYGGILSAFRQYPNHAWLTLACDLPYINESTLKQLVDQRDPTKLATCFHNPETKFPEPLISIWEPRAYPMLLEFLSQGYSCPRKVLINTDINEIEMKDLERMYNANDPDAKAKAMNQIEHEINKT